MSKVGYKWLLNVVATGGVDADRKVVGKSADANLNSPGSEVEITCRDSAGWKEFDYGNDEWDADTDHLWFPSDAAYVILQAAKVNKTLVDVQFRDAKAAGSAVLGASGSKGFDGTALVIGLSLNQPLNGKVSAKIKLRGTGPLVPALVA